MLDLEYGNAYKEVLEILKHISQEDYDKIPEEKVAFFERNSNKNYAFKYDINKTLDEQNVSKKAKIIIAILFRDYWATDEQREKIKVKEQHDRQIKEQEIQNKNNLDNNLKNENITSDNNKITLYKKTLIKTIISKIMNWIKLKK